MKDVWIIGGADGPTAIFVTGHKPHKNHKVSVLLKSAGVFSCLLLGLVFLLRCFFRRGK